MATTQRFPRSFLVLASILLALVLAVALYLITPPVFVSAGNHYAGGPDLLSLTGIYRCDIPGDPNCEPVRENLAAAVANDPNIANWWPIRVEFLTSTSI